MSTNDLLQRAIKTLLVDIEHNPDVIVLEEYDSIKQLYRVGDSCFSQYRENLIHCFEVLSQYADNPEAHNLFQKYLDIRDQEE